MNKLDKNGKTIRMVCSRTNPSGYEEIDPVTHQPIKTLGIDNENDNVNCDIHTPPESERQILRCAPPFDADEEHKRDLEYESRVDAESWQYDGPEEQEAE